MMTQLEKKKGGTDKPQSHPRRPPMTAAVTLTVLNLNSNTACHILRLGEICRVVIFTFQAIKLKTPSLLLSRTTSIHKAKREIENKLLR